MLRVTASGTDCPTGPDHGYLLRGGGGGGAHVGQRDAVDQLQKGVDLLV